MICTLCSGPGPRPIVLLLLLTLSGRPLSPEFLDSATKKSAESRNSTCPLPEGVDKIVWAYARARLVFLPFDVERSSKRKYVKEPDAQSCDSKIGSGRLLLLLVCTNPPALPW